MKLFHHVILIHTLLFIYAKRDQEIKPVAVGIEHSLVGCFWQITDIHWDLEYSEFGDQLDMCHNSTDNPQNASIGYYGNYLCDSPYPLVYASIQSMKSIEPHPDFILWTGDNAPHTDDADFTAIFTAISNITSEISLQFGPNIPLIPVLGNHDTFPKDDYPPSGDEFYSRYLIEGNWKQLLSEEAQKDFRRGGYYRVDLQSHVHILVLNTNLYYKFNEMGTGLKDPGGQFEWMKQQLQEARNTMKKVLISAHAPPGFWERNGGLPFFNNTYNDHFVDILNDYGDVITAQIYGHTHTDSFRIFGTSHDDLRSIAFVAPSLTPWYPTLLEGGTAINPSVRLFSYSSSSILDYVQYQLNLTEANNYTLNNFCLSSNIRGCEEEQQWSSLWREYYRATEAFGVSSLGVHDLATAFGNLVSNDSLFQSNFLRNSAGIDHGYCNETCKRTFLCAMTNLKIQSFSHCMHSSWSNSSSLGASSLLPALNVMVDESGSLSRSMVALAVSGVCLVVILGVMCLIIGIRRRRILNSSAKVSEFEWGNRHSGYRPLRSFEAD